MGQTPAIQIRDLTVAYKQKPVLWDIDLEVPTGVLLGVAGPNGAGKTTLIKAMLGLIKPISGQVLLFEKPIKTQRKRVAYVPQRNSVDWDFPTSALDVALMGRYGHLGFFRRPGQKDKKIAYEALETLGMTEYADRQISQLSGGQQQRVFLARALAQQADLYVLDEPFVGVDTTSAKVIITYLKRLKSEGKTVVVIHHNLQSLQSYFDWGLLLNVRNIGCGPMKDIFTKENLALAYTGQESVIDVGLFEDLV